MGVLIKIDGVNFEKNAIGKVKIPTCQHQYDNACDAVCNLCGAVREVAGHDYKAVVTDPTCENGGYTTYTCKNCGHSYVADYTAARGHNYVDGYCTICGAKDPAYVPTCKHEYDNDCDTTCNLCGATRTVTHNYVDGYCTVCGKRDPDYLYTLNDYPVTDTLIGLYDLGGTADASLANRSAEVGGTDGTDHSKTPDLQGATVSEDWVTFTGLANQSRMLTYVPTSLTAETITLVALFSVPAGQTPLNRVIIGNRGGSTATTQMGISLWNDGVRFGSNGKLTTKSFASINSNNFAILALTMDESHIRVVRYSNSGVTTLLEYEGHIEAWTNRYFVLGGDSTSTGGGTAHISLAAIHKGDMKDEQLEEICRFVKTYGEKKGLTIE